MEKLEKIEEKEEPEIEEPVERKAKTVKVKESKVCNPYGVKITNGKCAAPKKNSLICTMCRYK